MLSPIDEEEVVRQLDPAAGPSKCAATLPDLVGGHGPWQFRHWVVFFTATACTSLHLYSVFPFSSPGDCPCGNATFSDVRSTEMFLPAVQITEKACSSFSAAFLRTRKDNMYCSNVGLSIHAKCIYVLGILFSGLTIHLLTSKFGRRVPSLTSGLFLLATTIAVGWAQNAATFLTLRFLIGYTLANIYLLSIASLRECVSEEYILLYGLTGNIGWGIAHFILPLLAWLSGDWWTFSLYADCLPLFLFILMCFIPESVETYLSKGLRTRAHKVIRQAAWSNGYPTQDVEQTAQTLHHQKAQESTKMCTHDFKKYFELFLRFLIGFSAAFLYWTSLTLTEWRGVSRGAFFAVAATTEVAATLVLLVVTCFILSAKYLWAASTVMASASLTILYAQSTEASPVSTAPYLLAMFFSSFAFTLVLLKTLFQPFAVSASKWGATITGIALCIGFLAASLCDIQKLHGWNPKLLVIIAIPNLTIGTSIAVIPDRYFRL